MAKLYDSITELVGETPLVRLHRFEEVQGAVGNILGKFEYFNPSGSVKDRAALNIIEEAEKRGDIKPGDTLLDYTSGNTGIGEATFANAKGYKLVIVIQPGVSKERSQILKALGATLLQVTDVPGFPELLTNGLSMEGLDRVFKAFAKQNGWYYLNQCADINNSLAHVKGTGPEIWEATGGKVDYVVQLVGTGGTLSGLAKYFREKNSDVKIIGAQPAEQSKKNPNFPDRNTIDGVLNFNGVPEQNYPPLFTAFDTKWDECFDVVAEDAYETGRKLVSTEGFFVGQSEELLCGLQVR